MDQVSARTVARQQVTAQSWFMPLFLGGLVALAELAAQARLPGLGMLSQGGLVLLFLYLAAFASDGRLRTFCLLFAVLPATRLVSAGLPLGTLDPLIEEIIVQFARLVSALLVVRYLGLGREQLGLTAGALTSLASLLAGLVGALLGLGAFWVLQPRLVLDLWDFSGLAITVIVGLALFVAFVEVLVLCSLLLRASRPLLGDVAAVFYVALLFGVARFATFPLPYAALTVVEGVWLAWLTLRTRSVLPAVVAHGLMLIAFYAAAALFGS
jgi:hypothetical protein